MTQLDWQEQDENSLMPVRKRLCMTAKDSTFYNIIIPLDYNSSIPSTARMPDSLFSLDLHFNVIAIDIKFRMAFKKPHDLQS